MATFRYNNNTYVFYGTISKWNLLKAPYKWLYKTCLLALQSVWNNSFGEHILVIRNSKYSKKKNNKNKINEKNYPDKKTPWKSR